MQVGHAYFLTDQGGAIRDVRLFARVVAEDIIPLLQEYCYDDHALLARLLGTEIVDVERQRLRTELLAPERSASLIQELQAHLLAQRPELAAWVEEDDEAPVDEEALPPDDAP